MDAALITAGGAVAVALVGGAGAAAGHWLSRRQRAAGVEETEARTEEIEARTADIATQVYERVVSRLEDELAKAEAGRAELLARIEHLEQQLSRRDAREQEYARDLAEVRRERDDLRTELAAANATIASSRAEIDRLSGLTQHAQEQLRPA